MIPVSPDRSIAKSLAGLTKSLQTSTSQGLTLAEGQDGAVLSVDSFLATYHCHDKGGLMSPTTNSVGPHTYSVQNVCFLSKSTLLPESLRAKNLRWLLGARNPCMA